MDNLREDEREDSSAQRGDGWFAMHQLVTRLQDRLSAERTEREKAEARIPHEGDGSCDHCGRVPAINIPTSLCHECRDGVKRAEAAERELAEARKALSNYKNAKARSGYPHWLDDEIGECAECDPEDLCADHYHKANAAMKEKP